MAPQIAPFNWRRHSREVLEFQREIYESNFPGFVVDEQFLRDYASQMRRSLNNPAEGLFVLEEADHRPCGFLWLSLISTMVDACVGYIRNIYVDRGLRGQGHGRRLLALAEDWCLRRGVTRLALDASCCNTRAVDLYRQSGFETVRVRMEKSLVGGAEGHFADELRTLLGEDGASFDPGHTFP